MILSLMTPDAIRRLGDLFEEQWRARLPAWERMDRIVLADERLSGSSRGPSAPGRASR